MLARSTTSGRTYRN